MKKYLKWSLIIIVIEIIFCNGTAVSQISKTKISKVDDKVEPFVFDSTFNYLGENVHSYIGQTLYLPPLPEYLREYGYDGFYVDTTTARYGRTMYDRAEGGYSYKTKYETLKDKYFDVQAVYLKDSTKYSLTYFLALKPQKEDTVIYYEYNAKWSSNYNFIMVGFYEKTKKLLVGEKFVFKEKELEGVKDIETGEEITVKLGEVWGCDDLTINEERGALALLLKSKDGKSIMMEYGRIFNITKDEPLKKPFNLFNWVFTNSKAKKHKKRFGNKKWNLILKSKVQVGFTKEMVLLSWGEPKKKNKSSYNEQWVYDEQYLYFKNGKLKSFN